MGGFQGLHPVGSGRRRRMVLTCCINHIVIGRIIDKAYIKVAGHTVAEDTSHNAFGMMVPIEYLLK